MVPTVDLSRRIHRFSWRGSWLTGSVFIWCHVSVFMFVSIFVCMSVSPSLIGWGYYGGSPIAVPAWRPWPLWEPSPSHPITRGFSVCVFCMCVCVYCFVLYFVCFLFLGFLYFCSVFSFSTLILLVGSFHLWNCIPDNLYCVGGDVKPCSINQSLYRYAAREVGPDSDQGCCAHWSLLACRCRDREINSSCDCLV